jgi:hypothetical protein
MNNNLYSLSMLTILMSVMIVSCSDSGEPQKEDWLYLGLKHAEIIQYELPDTIRTEDTLFVILDGTTQGRPEFSHFDVVRDTFEIELTLWAHAWEWIGKGVVPPYNPCVRCEYQALPPHWPGYVTIILNQPDSTALVDSVLVEE